MSKKEWFILFLLFVGYLFMGASIFYTIERQLEEERRGEAMAEQKDLKELLEKQYLAISKESSVDDLANKLTVYCDREFSKVLAESNVTIADNPKPYTWTYYNAFFFSLTTLSTIGYGNLSPSSDEGRILVIFYSLIGIPFNGIVLAQLGEFFGSVFLRAHHRYKNHVYVSRINLILDILLYLVPGMVIFIFAPAFLFKYFEEWSFCESIYYAFVTLTTIGYGDLVAGQSTNESSGDMAYKIFLLVWIMFGLGYLVMILGFISRAMKSKRLNRLEQKLAHTIKQTQSKIWNEFVQDVNYIRRAINEAYINRVKPVYREKKPLISERRLTVSCPDFNEWPILRPKSEIERLKEREEENKRPWGKKRRRAFSENYDGLQLDQGLPRVMSEGALGDIDIVATFRDRPRPSLAAVDLETEQFLANLVNQRRLSTHDDSDIDLEGGIHLFSDEEILQSEQYSTRGSSSASWVRPARSRANSEIPYLYSDSPTGYDRQKTWSGVDSLHARTMIKNMRTKAGDQETEDIKDGKSRPSPAKSFRRLSMAALNFFSGSEKKNKITKDKPKKERRTGNTFSRSSSGHRLSLQENDSKADIDSLNYFTQNGRRPSLLDMLAPSSTGASTPMSPVLEQTSLADFIRVMSTLRKLEEQQAIPSPRDGRSRHPSLSYLFNPPLPREVMRARASSASTGNLSRERRFSQVPTRADQAVFRQRAASISPGFINEPPQRLQPTGRYTPPTRAMSPPPIPPTVVVTSPDGHHRFSVHNVASPPRNEGFLGPRRRRGDSLSEIISKP